MEPAWVCVSGLKSGAPAHSGVAGLSMPSGFMPLTLARPKSRTLRQPLDLSGYAGSFLCNDLCNADDYFCVRESIAHASFSHCTLASVSFEEPDVTSLSSLYCTQIWPSY
jgi:hypothetical protein